MRWSEGDEVTTPRGTGRVLKQVGLRVRVEHESGSTNWVEVNDVKIANVAAPDVSDVLAVTEKAEGDKAVAEEATLVSMVEPEQKPSKEEAAEVPAQEAAAAADKMRFWKDKADADKAAADKAEQEKSKQPVQVAPGRWRHADGRETFHIGGSTPAELSPAEMASLYALDAGSNFMGGGRYE